jgi:hypothetical protein
MFPRTSVAAGISIVLQTNVATRDGHGDLRKAYAHSERIRRIVSRSPMEDGAAVPVRPKNLNAALAAMRKAEAAVGKELSGLDTRPW